MITLFPSASKKTTQLLRSSDNNTQDLRPFETENIQCNSGSEGFKELNLKQIKCFSSAPQI